MTCHCKYVFLRCFPKNVLPRPLFFFISHLSFVFGARFEHAEGRRSGIELVGLLATQLPAPVLDAHAQLLFLPLVLRLANDDDSGCRRSASEALRHLLARASPAAFHELYAFVEGWLGVDTRLAERDGAGGGDGAATTAAAAGYVGVGGGSGGSGGSGAGAGSGMVSAAAPRAPVDPVLAATACAVAALSVEARPDLIKRRAGGSAVFELLSALRALAVGALEREQRLLASDAAASAGRARGSFARLAEARGGSARSVGGGRRPGSGWDFGEAFGGGSGGESSDGGSGGWSDVEDEDEETSAASEAAAADRAALPPWRVLYQCLLCFEKVLRTLPSSAEQAMRRWDGGTAARMAQASAAALVAGLGPGEDDGGSSGDVLDGDELNGGAAVGALGKARLEALGGRGAVEFALDGGWFAGLLVGEALVFGHPWVRLAASRALGLLLSRRTPQRLALAAPDGGGGGGGGSGGSGGEYLLCPGTLVRLARRLLTQLDEPDGVGGLRGAYLSPALAEQSVKNLVFLAQALHHHPHLCGGGKSGGRGRGRGAQKAHTAAATAMGDGSEDVDEDAEEEEVKEKVNDESNSGGKDEDVDGEASTASDNNDDDDDDDDDDDEEDNDDELASGSGLALSGSGGGGRGGGALGYLMRRTNMMSRRRGDDRRAAVCQWFGVAATQPHAVVMAHLPAMVDALHRLRIDGQSKVGGSGGGGGGGGVGVANVQMVHQARLVTSGASPAVASATAEAAATAAKAAAEKSAAATTAAALPLPVGELVEEVLALLEAKAGAGAFLACLSKVQARFLARRDRRKRASAAEAVVDPAAHAARKLERNRQKKDAEKRKKRAFGEMRNAGGSRGKGGKGKGGKGKGTVRGSSSHGLGLKHMGGGFGRKRPKG